MQQFAHNWHLASCQCVAALPPPFTNKPMGYPSSKISRTKSFVCAALRYDCYKIWWKRRFNRSHVGIVVATGLVPIHNHLAWWCWSACVSWNGGTINNISYSGGRSWRYTFGHPACVQTLTRTKGNYKFTNFNIEDHRNSGGIKSGMLHSILVSNTINKWFPQMRAPLANIRCSAAHRYLEIVK